jgi:hypothetical protein
MDAETLEEQLETAIGRAAVWAWVGLCGYVAAYDTWALTKDQETLSGAFGRSLAGRRAKWLVGTVWILTTLHLFRRLPRAMDPFHYYGGFLKKLRNA